MRFRFAWLPIAFFCALGVTMWLGCKPSETADSSGSDGDQTAQTQSGDGQQEIVLDAGTPDAAVITFLNAVRAGNEDTASAMLTDKARTEMQNAEMYVQPPGSPNAQFQIGDVRLQPEHGGAYVDSSWTDIIDNGQQSTYAITWILRQEHNGWRVAGMSTELYPNQPPLVLNFENPADMQAQVQQAELARQNGVNGEIRQATLPSEGGGNAPR